jgi:hypothetical protein
VRARGRRRRGTRRRASRIRAITLRNAPRRRCRVSRASVQSGFSEGTHHVGRCVFFLPTSGRRVSERAFCDDADAGVSRNSEGVSPEPSNRVERDLWRGVRSLRRGSVCARRRPASSRQPHHHTDCFGFQPRPNAGGAKSYGQRDSECTFQVLQLKNQGLIALLSLKSIVEPFFCLLSEYWRHSRTRARLTVAASHTLGVLPDRTSFKPRSSPSEGLALNTQDASAHGGQRRRTWIRRSLPRWQGRFRRQRRPRRPRRLR